MGSIQFIGTATVLIRCGGFTILTDPNFLHKHDTVHLGYGLRSKRLTEPALELHSLPPLDFVLLSHFHEDHFDRKVEAGLDKLTPIITTPSAAKELRRRGFSQAEGLDTWECKAFSKQGTALTVSAMPGRHGAGLLAQLLPDVMGSMLDFQAEDGYRQRLYITGDTLMFEGITSIPQRFPDIDLALLHLGGTRILGITLTMDARQGVQMLKVIKPRLAIPIHYNDYKVFKSPLADFQGEVETAGLTQAVQYLSHGETYEFTLTQP